MVTQTCSSTWTKERRPRLVEFLPERIESFLPTVFLCLLRMKGFHNFLRWTTFYSDLLKATAVDKGVKSTLRKEHISKHRRVSF
ncbi:hypothetical protein CHARACLAT_007240 [Characodon lateralis]|uniref:Uncharacterized protein n=1 Tax=Characodon lateralis TaxID=208331 RepID=A0ABU7CVL1_9TELE|nr:hypothetical protein [Characodon lateralis]